MVDISKLKTGEKVHYKPFHFKEEEFENGVVKEIPKWSVDSVRVVYSCAGDWKNYKDYTSALTNVANLYIGWKYLEVKNEDSIFEECNAT